MVRYSIAACNLNMADTLERSLRGVLDHLPDGFEFVIVDGGSTDGSREILDRLDAEYDALRPVFLEPDPTRKLGADRNVAVQESRGEYIVDSMDVDDHYYPGIVGDFVEVYEQLRTQLSWEFVLHGTGMYVAPRDLHLDYPFPNVSRCEDRYFWRHLFADDKLLWLKHGPLGDGSLGYDRDFLSEVRNDVEEKTCDFQMGVSLSSSLQWALSPNHPYVIERERGRIGTALKRAYDLVTYPVSYLRARDRERVSLPARFRRKGTLEWVIRDRARWLSEIETEYGVTIDRSRLSERGRNVFYSRTGSFIEGE